MVRQLKSKIGGAIGAGAMLFIACGALLWHTLACTESPMSFAQSGDLAFTTMEPYDSGETVALRDGHAYRVMVLPKGAKEVKVLDESTDCMFSGPVYSPDGKKVAYLRIPLLSSAELDTISSGLKAREEQQTKPVASQPAITWPVKPLVNKPASQPVSQPADESIDMYALPSTATFDEYCEARENILIIPCELVERDAGSGRILTANKVDMPLILDDSVSAKDLSLGMLFTYILSRVQYSPDQSWIYLCLGSMDKGSAVMAIEPATGNQRLLTVLTNSAIMSPDGKTIAFLQKKCIGFVRTDGTMTIYRRWEDDVAIGSMVWKDAQTIVFISAKNKIPTLIGIKTDGTIVSQQDLSVLPKDTNLANSQLAMSPNGKAMVISTDKKTYFMDAKGKVLATWENEEMPLAQPTFTPDGKAVVFKLMHQAEGDYGRAEAIVFFSPNGKELSRVAIPHIKEGTTQPVSTQPAK